MTIRSAKTGTLGSFAGNVASVATPTPATVNSVTVGNTGVTADVAFTIPSIGAAANNFTVTSNPGGLTASGNVSPLTVSGLTPNTSYTFSFTGTGNVGTGYAGPSSNSVTTNSAYVLLATLRNSQNWTVPSGVSQIAVFTTGGGTGGNAGNAGGQSYTRLGVAYFGGNGGSGGISSGVTSFKDYNVNSGQVFAVNIGAGGNAGAGGGTSNFGGLNQVSGNSLTSNVTAVNGTTNGGGAGGNFGEPGNAGGIDNSGVSISQNLTGFGTATFLQSNGGGGGGGGSRYSNIASGGTSNIGGGSGGGGGSNINVQGYPGNTGNVGGGGGGGGGGRRAGSAGAGGAGAAGAAGAVVIYGKY